FVALRLVPEFSITSGREIASPKAKCKSFSTSNVELLGRGSQYLNIASKDQSFSFSQGKDNQDYNLGLTPTGILVYQGDSKIGLFFWPNILTIAMNGQKLKIVVAEENEATRQVTEHSFCFVLPNKSACKNLWKSAVEHHTFFRLTDRSQPPPKRKQLFRLRSRFHASFRTEYQLQNPDLFGSSSFRKKKKPVSSGMSSPTATSPPPSAGDRFGKVATPGLTRTASSFRRTPSKRFNSRPSFSNRSALEERRAKRHRVPPSEETLQSNAFDKARTVVNVERACLRDPNWVPSGSPSSAGTGPRIRTRPVEYPPKSSPTPSPIAVRVTPQLSRRQAPSPPVKSARKPNGAGVPVNRCPAEEWYVRQVSVYISLHRVRLDVLHRP
ncbi:band 4.1-like protein 5, partial [Clonorchis sinensis]